MAGTVSSCSDILLKLKLLDASVLLLLLVVASCRRAWKSRSVSSGVYALLVMKTAERSRPAARRSDFDGGVNVVCSTVVGGHSSSRYRANYDCMYAHMLLDEVRAQTRNID